MTAELRKLERQRLIEHDAFLKHEAAARSGAEKALETRTTENERLSMELMQACMLNNFKILLFIIENID